MARWYFVPDDWEMSDELRQWTHTKGLTDKVIEEEIESFKDHQYKRPMMCADRCWRNWVKNGIKWANITPSVKKEYRGIEELSEEQKKADAARAWNEVNRLKGVK